VGFGSAEASFFVASDWVFDFLYLLGTDASEVAGDGDCGNFVVNTTCLDDWVDPVDVAVIG
jgi:hypothetical protein